MNHKSLNQNTMKPHQISALVFIGGIIIGATLHYALYSKTVSLKVKEAYETGFDFGKEQGKDEECQDFIKRFNEADSVYIGSNEIKFYYK